ncbi:unnamed protein product [Clavelina lepadiformis]|uniref:Uncharacterized protein n=1 Tax=Clavelina lepadiformis TaxID=159417 RepID=A0ABP0G7Z6_CLALP
MRCASIYSKDDNFDYYWVPFQSIQAPQWSQALVFTSTIENQHVSSQVQKEYVSLKKCLSGKLTPSKFSGTSLLLQTYFE